MKSVQKKVPFATQQGSKAWFVANFSTVGLPGTHTISQGEISITR